MSSYEQFAYIYDELMEEVDYPKWAEFIDLQINKHNLKGNAICELGCGTGTMTQTLFEKGYDMIGVDLSYDMLMVAREKSVEKNYDILYLNQDMREYELYGSVDVLIAVCDTLNYIDNQGLEAVFKSLERYLNPGGLFLFDLNTEFKFEQIYGDKSFSELGEDFAYIWENQYDADSKTNEYFISFFVENEDESYERFNEYHIEYVHDISSIEKLANKYNLVIEGIFDDYSEKEISDKTERMTFVIQKPQD